MREAHLFRPLSSLLDEMFFPNCLIEVKGQRSIYLPEVLRGGFIMAHEGNKPTQLAEMFFSAAADVGNRVYGTKTLSSQDQAYMLSKIAEGLGQMAIGLRATYIVLEEVRDLLRRQSAGRT